MHIMGMGTNIDVKSIRLKLGATQQELADAVGVNLSTVWRWENGHDPRGPARKLLERLAGPTPEREASE